MTKETLKNAITDMLNGKDAGHFYDELTALLSIVNNASVESISAAWSEIHIDAEEE